MRISFVKEVKMKKTLYIERSTGECRNGNWVEALDLEGVERIVVGTGPGSFAGIRSAIAFAQGYQLGRPEVEVLGLPSPCAIAAQLDASAAKSLAVVGDARQGKIWLALFRRLELVREVFQVEATAEAPETLRAAIQETLGDEAEVVSPDDRRIGELLRTVFGDRYRGEALPTTAGLEAYAQARPELLKPEPLPIYLNPAVRT